MTRPPLRGLATIAILGIVTMAAGCAEEDAEPTSSPTAASDTAASEPEPEPEEPEEPEPTEEETLEAETTLDGETVDKKTLDKMVVIAVRDEATNGAFKAFSDKEIVEAARNACQAFDSGSTVAAMARQAKKSGLSNTDIGDLGVLVGVAIYSYCPEHDHMLD